MLQKSILQSIDLGAKIQRYSKWVQTSFRIFVFSRHINKFCIERTRNEVNKQDQLIQLKFQNKIQNGIHIKMSQYGYTKGSPIRDHKEKIHPETAREQERLRQYLIAKEQSRYKDGPTGFQKRKVPKLTFNQKYGAVIGGFFGLGCATLFFFNPIYQFFVAPLVHKVLNPNEQRLRPLDPEEVFEREVLLSYKVEHCDEFQDIKKNLGNPYFFFWSQKEIKFSIFLTDKKDQRPFS